mmetsp:Transcript_96093/g.286800  ORF Transcript_96093/g.286800 Transcript_96093/m.286800 type:complete len:254 (+) Transcript_96093:348-1109(+)
MSPGLSSSMRISSILPDSERRVACVAFPVRFRCNATSTAALTNPISHSEPLTTSATVAASRRLPKMRAPSRTMNIRTCTDKRHANTESTARRYSACPRSTTSKKSAGANKQSVISIVAASPTKKSAVCSNSTVRDSRLSGSRIAAVKPRRLRGGALRAPEAPPAVKILAPSILAFSALQSWFASTSETCVTVVVLVPRLVFTASVESPSGASASLISLISEPQQRFPTLSTVTSKRQHLRSQFSECSPSAAHL